jgi:hypothetical protein
MDIPGYAADVGKRAWFTRRLDGPKRSIDVEKEEKGEKDITRGGEMRMMKRNRKRDVEEDGDDN